MGTGMFKNKRRIDWQKLRGPRAWTAFLTATALGSGLCPFAPGTAGSLVALPLAYAVSGWTDWSKLALWLLFAIVGTWAAKVFDGLMSTDDNQNIVIDEVIGIGIAAWTATDWRVLAIAFVAFRLFDIIKIPPVRQADRWSKIAAERHLGGRHMARWIGAFGVIFDDVLAGVQALIVVKVVTTFW